MTVYHDLKQPLLTAFAKFWQTTNQIILGGGSDGTGKIVTINCPAPAADRIASFPVLSANDDFLFAAQSQSVSNKTFGNTNSFTIKTNSITFQDSTTTTKQFIFACSAITSGQTRTKTWANNSGTVAELNLAQTYTANLTFNNGFTSYGFGASFQTGGLSLGERDDTTTTGSNVEYDNSSTNDYPQIILKNASLSSIKGIQMGNSFIILFKNQTGSDLTFKHNASVSALVSQIDTGFGQDVVVGNGRYIIFTFNVDTQKVEIFGGTFDRPFTGSILSSSPTGGIGYKAGAGGAVTQATDKTTSVTLNKITGQITMHNASLAGGASVQFTLSNSTIAAGDAVLATSGGGFTSTYKAVAMAAQAGSCVIEVTNTGTTQGEAVTINFSVIKSVNS